MQHFLGPIGNKARSANDSDRACSFLIFSEHWFVTHVWPGAECRTPRDNKVKPPQPTCSLVVLRTKNALFPRKTLMLDSQGCFWPSQHRAGNEVFGELLLDHVSRDSRALCTHGRKLGFQSLPDVGHFVIPHPRCGVVRFQTRLLARNSSRPVYSSLIPGVPNPKVSLECPTPESLECPTPESPCSAQPQSLPGEPNPDCPRSAQPQSVPGMPNPRVSLPREGEDVRSKIILTTFVL